MSQTEKAEGTKIVQAAKDLSVTTVTVRRYINEFKIETATDKNGIKVLPESAMQELKEVRRLKEDGLTNPKVLEELENQRAKGTKKTRARRVEVTANSKAKPKESAKVIEKQKEKVSDEKKDKDKKNERESSKENFVESKEKDSDKEKSRETKERESEESRDGDRDKEKFRDRERTRDNDSDGDRDRKPYGRSRDDMSGRRRAYRPKPGDGESEEAPAAQGKGCYRSKRKDRRYGGDKQKNVIQHPHAQQVADKMARKEAPPRERQQRFNPPPKPEQSTQSVSQPKVCGLQNKVRSYRKAIDDTRRHTSSLKRRLERPDLPTGERRWLEQVYAYQLILHQGWRHLAEYRAANKNKEDD